MPLGQLLHTKILVFHNASEFAFDKFAAATLVATIKTPLLAKLAQTAQGAALVVPGIPKHQYTAAQVYTAASSHKNRFSLVQDVKL